MLSDQGLRIGHENPQKGKIPPLLGKGEKGGKDRINSSAGDVSSGIQDGEVFPRTQNTRRGAKKKRHRNHRQKKGRSSRNERTGGKSSHAGDREEREGEGSMGMEKCERFIDKENPRTEGKRSAAQYSRGGGGSFESRALNCNGRARGDFWVSKTTKKSINATCVMNKKKGTKSAAEEQTLTATRRSKQREKDAPRPRKGKRNQRNNQSDRCKTFSVPLGGKVPFDAPAALKPTPTTKEKKEENSAAHRKK